MLPRPWCAHRGTGRPRRTGAPRQGGAHSAKYDAYNVDGGTMAWLRSAARWRAGRDETITILTVDTRAGATAVTSSPTTWSLTLLAELDVRLTVPRQTDSATLIPQPTCSRLECDPRRL